MHQKNALVAAPISLIVLPAGERENQLPNSPFTFLMMLFDKWFR